MKLYDFCYINPTEKLERNQLYDFVEMADLIPGNRYVHAKSKEVFNGSYSKFTNKDVLMAKITPCLENGKISQYIGDNKAFGSTEFNIFRAKENISDPDFLYYLISSDYVKDIAVKSMTGACGRQRANTDEIKQIEVGNIDIKIQQKIAKILSNYDDLIENNNKRIKILEEMAQKIYKEWFVDFKYPGHETTTFKDTELGKIPSDWEVKKVSDISVLYKGKSYKSSELVEDKKGLPFLNLKCIERKGGFRRDGLKWFDGKYSDNHIVYPEDIIMAVTDLTQERLIVARPARIPHNWYEKYVMSMDLVKLKPKDNIDISYFYSLLKYSNFSEEVKNHANGANVLHLNPQNIEMYKLVVASEKVRNQFGKIVNQIYNNIDVLYLKNEMLVQTRDLLLPRLMSGEINVENLEIA